MSIIFIFPFIILNMHPLISAMNHYAIFLLYSFILFTGNSFLKSTKQKKIKLMFKSNYQVKMLSYASKGHNPIAMVSNNSRVILRCIMTSLTLCCLVMTLPISLCYSSVVNKHQLLALSVLCL